MRGLLDVMGWTDGYLRVSDVGNKYRFADSSSMPSRRGAEARHVYAGDRSDPEALNIFVKATVGSLCYVSRMPSGPDGEFRLGVLVEKAALAEDGRPRPRFIRMDDVFSARFEGDVAVFPSRDEILRRYEEKRRERPDQIIVAPVRTPRVVPSNRLEEYHLPLRIARRTAPIGRIRLLCTAETAENAGKQRNRENRNGPHPLI